MQKSQLMRGATQSVAEFVAADEYPLRTDEDRAAAAVSLIDTAAAAIVGATSDFGSKVVDFARKRSATGKVAVPGVSGDLTAPWAAFVMGSLACANALGDLAPYGAAGAPVWSALLALAQSEGITDDAALVDAYSVGIEVAMAVVDAGVYLEAERGFSGTSAFGALAAAVACSRLLGLDETRAAAAVAIVASELGGVIANNGTDVEGLHGGFAARNGLQAAVLARAGIYGAVDVLEARQGLGEALFGLRTSTLSEIDTYLDRPAKLASRLLMRNYPAHGDHQRVLAALGSQIRDGRLASADIELVEVSGVKPTSGGVRFDIPGDRWQALDSLRYTIACVTRGGNVALEDVEDAAVRSDAMKAELARVRINILTRWDPSLRSTQGPTTSIRVTKRDHTVVDIPIADATNLERHAVRAKWLRIAPQVQDVDARGSLESVLGCLDLEQDKLGGIVDAARRGQ